MRLRPRTRPAARPAGALVRACALLCALTLLPAPPAAADTTADPASGELQQELWALPAIGVPEVWETTRGGGITVAVVDTPVDPAHPDLVDNLAIGSGADTGGADLAHGTAMAGLIAAHGHGAEHAAGLTGVAPDASLLAVPVPEGGDGAEREAALARAIRQAATGGAQVISLSYSGAAPASRLSEAERQAIEFAADQGAVLVAAAGDTADGAAFPGAHDAVLAVGPVDQSLAPDPLAGSGTELWAPGTALTSTAPGGGYADTSGAAAAASVTAGVAALVRAAHPRLSPAQVVQALGGPPAPSTEESAEPTGSSTDSTAEGATGTAAPVLDAAAALAAAAELDAALPSPSAAAPPPDETADTGVDWLVLTAIIALGVAGLTVLLLLTLRRRSYRWTG
ncbi:S8 family serine peptidase [Allonocardiopsis opalescens]|uniref:Subtilisin family serine protease n=1 Tax=Allonocardiopsis opalescens TaxID=1144618 RepID=A0A2T0QA68_9ACTN|nr:S8 family serine peptidase [Allonocardiopsis opalescens]PRY00702.1 subtilisin family serine protease [Allonocardiopsis opalescens]